MTPNNSVLTDYAYAEILRMILSADIKPGSRIREDILAEQMGISRTPVREAVNRLTQNGFITNIKRKGLYCIKFTRKDLLDLIELRIALESLSFEKCIALASEENINEFQKIITGFYEKLNEIMKKDEDSIGKEIALLHNEYDVLFHVSIARVSASARLIQYVTEVENMLLIARMRIYRSDDRYEIVKLSWKQHEDMLEAIRSKNMAKARELLNIHMDLMRKTQVNIEADDEITEYSRETEAWYGGT